MNIYKYSAFVFLSIFIVSCGGGGGSPTSSDNTGKDLYTGLTTSGKLSNISAKNIADQLTNRTNIPKAQAQGVQKNINNILANKKQIMTSNESKKNIQLNIDQLLPCDSGSASVKGSFNDYTGAGSATTTYHKCLQNGVIFDGAIHLNSLSNYNLEISDWLLYRISYSNFTMESAESHVSLDGNTLIERRIKEQQRIETHNFTQRNFIENNSVHFENMVETFDLDNSSLFSRFSIAGRLYISDVGYFQISTINKGTLSNTNTLYSGLFFIEGAESSATVNLAYPIISHTREDIPISKLNYPYLYDDGPHQYKPRRIISLDSDGDNIPDIQSTTLWPIVDKNETLTLPDIGVDKVGFSVEKNTPIKMSCNDCFDDDGDFLSFRWILKNGPDGISNAELSNKPEFQFTPQNPGLYEFELTVTDESLNQVKTTVYLQSYELVPIEMPANLMQSYKLPTTYSPKLNKMIMWLGNQSAVTNLTTGKIEYTFENPGGTNSYYTTSLGIDGSKLIIEVNGSAQYSVLDLENNLFTYLNMEARTGLTRTDGALVGAEGESGFGLVPRPHSTNYYGYSNKHPNDYTLNQMAVYGQTDGDFTYKYPLNFTVDHLQFSTDGMLAAGYSFRDQSVKIVRMGDSAETDGQVLHSIPYPVTPWITMEPQTQGLWIGYCIRPDSTCDGDGWTLYDINGNKKARFLPMVRDHFIRNSTFMISEAGQRNLFYLQLSNDPLSNWSQPWLMRF